MSRSVDCCHGQPASARLVRGNGVCQWKHNAFPLPMKAHRWWLTYGHFVLWWLPENVEVRKELWTFMKSLEQQFFANLSIIILLPVEVSSACEFFSEKSWWFLYGAMYHIIDKLYLRITNSVLNYPFYGVGFIIGFCCCGVKYSLFFAFGLYPVVTF